MHRYVSAPGQETHRQAGAPKMHMYVATPGQDMQLSPTPAERPANVYAPEGRERLPPDRAARQRMLEKRLRKAHENAAEESAEPLILGRIALGGLAFLEVIRCVAWWDSNMPGSVFGVHFLTTTTDAICVVSMLPLYTTGTQGQCVQIGCVGPILTLIFAMFVVDLGALCTFLILATPKPLSQGSRSVVDVAEAIVGVWDFVLFASVFLQVALCASSWRIYTSLRLNGLYPPGSIPLGQVEEVSFLELICEAEDAKLIKECDCRGAGAVDDGETTLTPARATSATSAR